MREPSVGEVAPATLAAWLTIRTRDAGVTWSGAALYRETNADRRDPGRGRTKQVFSSEQAAGAALRELADRGYMQRVGARFVRADYERATDGGS